MSRKTSIALALAIALSPAVALAASKHQARPAQNEGQKAYGYSQTAPSTSEPEYMAYQDRSIARD